MGAAVTKFPQRVGSEEESNSRAETELVEPSGADPRRGSALLGVRRRRAQR
jgi:hypothetical protein